MNAAADVIRVTRSVVDLDRILGLGTLSPAGGRAALPAPQAIAAAAAPRAAFARGAEKLLAAHDAPAVSTVCLAATEGGVDEARLRDWLVRSDTSSSERAGLPCDEFLSLVRPFFCTQEALLWEPGSSAARAPGAPPPEVLRAKALLRVVGGGGDDASAEPRARILQVVRQLYEISDAAAPLPAGGLAASRMVLIGRHLDGAALAASLADVGAFVVEGTTASAAANVQT
jgi:hypothetical protein